MWILLATLFIDANDYCERCPRCQQERYDAIQPYYYCGDFLCMGIDFMGLFPFSFGNVYILLAID